MISRVWIQTPFVPTREPTDAEWRTLGYHHDRRRYDVEHGMRMHGQPTPRYPAYVAVPEWLRPGVKIRLSGPIEYGPPVTVLAVDGGLTIAEGEEHAWPIDTSIVVESWEVVPEPAGMSTPEEELCDDCGGWVCRCKVSA